MLDLIAGDRNRTYDPRITNALLYQLSYSGVKAAYVKQTGPATPVGQPRALGADGRQIYPRRRRRITRSMPATSMPGGGDGKWLNCTSRSATSLNAPVCSS